jgi:hypothetical protein
MKFAQSNKKHEDYGLKAIEYLNTELEREKLLRNPEQEFNTLNNLNPSKPNTTEQQSIFNEIMNAVKYSSKNPDTPGKFFSSPGLPVAVKQN